MSSIRVRLFLLLSLVFSSILVLSLLIFNDFLKLRSIRTQMAKGHAINIALSDIQKLDPTLLEKIRKIQSELTPENRRVGVDKMLETIEQKKTSLFKSHYTAFQTNEAEFQRYNFGQMEYIEEEMQFLIALNGLTFFVGFLALHFFIGSHVIRPIKNLAFRMHDFLNNRFTYKFDIPTNNEIGNLHSTFNTLAQRVISHTEELKNFDQAKSDFLSIASHELRTPLTSIKGSLSLLQSGIVGSLNEMSTELLQIAEVESDRLIRLINDLLDLAKIEAGKVPLKCDWVQVDDFIMSTFQSLQGLAHNAKVELQYTEENPSAYIYIDRDRIQQVLTNLMSNAIKFSPPSSVVAVSVLQHTDGSLRFDVKDQGRGIDPQDQELIFQKFRQASGPNNPIVKGTGLGLAIAKALVEEHKGQIGLKSSPGEGSTFFFTVPKWKFAFADGVRSAS